MPTPTRTQKGQAYLDRALKTILTPTPEAVPKGRSYDEKALKEIGRTFKLAERELARMSRQPPLTAAERKERRASQQRERRAAKALSEVVL
jgi:hypothetical protein